MTTRRHFLKSAAAAGGIALSHVGGLPMIAGAAMGVGAMIAAALKMPFTAVLPPASSSCPTP